MRETQAAEARPYHHGDLSRALIDAARRLLESEGPSALSLRAVAREAGVSPAAPYHHFKDKGELLDAVAHEGWEMLDAALASAKAAALTSSRDPMAELGVAYVLFAQQNPALYRVMYDTARDKEELPAAQSDDDSAFCKVRDTMVEAGADPEAAVDLELATIAAWCAAHGLADMASFKQFEPLKVACGGELGFLRAVFDHLGLSSKLKRA
jgi:AcrR family transcriptional regulator